MQRCSTVSTNGWPYSGIQTHAAFGADQKKRMLPLFLLNRDTNAQLFSSKSNFLSWFKVLDVYREPSKQWKTKIQKWQLFILVVRLSFKLILGISETTILEATISETAILKFRASTYFRQKSALKIFFSI